MAADAFTATLVMHDLQTGAPRTQRLSVSDVVGEFALFVDRASEKSVNIPQGENWVIDDIIADEDGADTTAFELIKGSSGSGSFIKYNLANNLTTSPQARCQGLFGRHLSSGQRYALKQV